MTIINIITLNIRSNNLTVQMITRGMFTLRTSYATLQYCQCDFWALMCSPETRLDLHYNIITNSWGYFTIS